MPGPAEKPRAIVHLDADAFFASVEQAADLRLRGQPIAVGGEKRGIIASASYEARKFGVYTPMPTVRARKLCPRLIVLPGDFEKYEQFSRWMFSYAYDFTPDVEIASIDEGYFDLSGACKSPVEIAQIIRRAIGQALKISVSEGIAINKLVSQIASKLHKPAAFAAIPRGHEISFLHPLPNRWLPGVGPKVSDRLNAAGLARIGQIAATPLELLELLLGRWAVDLRRYANGIDERPIVPVSAPARSYSQQETFEADTTDETCVEAVLRRMADHLMAKVRADGKSIRTVTVKVRYNDMAEDQRSESLLEPTDLETDIYSRLRALLRQAWKRRVSLRMVSLKFANVYDGRFRAELPLEASARRHAARQRLADVVDELRRVHGHDVILRGHDFVLQTGQPLTPALSLSEREREKRSSRRGKAVGHSSAPLLEREQRDGSPVRVRTTQTADGCSRACKIIVRATPVLQPRGTRHVPLHVHSYYSFLNSTLAPAAIVELAQRYELPAIALTDQANLHGAVEFVQAARKAGIKPILGAEICVEGKPLRLYVENATGYRNLCRILSRCAHGIGALAARSADFQSAVSQVGNLPGGIVETRHSRLQIGDTADCKLSEFAEGLLAVSAEPTFARLFPDRFYLEIASRKALRHYNKNAGLPAVAALPVHYAAPGDRWKFDVVQSIRTLTLLKQTHPEKVLDGDVHFRSPAEMGAVFKEHPELLERSLEFAGRCAFELPLGQPQFPAFRPPDGSTAREFLRALVMQGLRERYGESQIADRRSQIAQELAIIAEVGYEEYFLVVWDILQECRRRGIEWITRGSAADSLVCYCLRISDVCPVRFDLYFRRFLNKDRMALNKLPDIDVDFPHDRKDDVIDLIFEKYGPEHAAVVGGSSTFQARSAFAEVAKVLGVAERDVRRFTEHFPWSFGGSRIPALREPAGHAFDLPVQASSGCAAQSDEAGGFATGRPEVCPAKTSPRGGQLLQLLKASSECRDLPLEEEPYRSALHLAGFLDGFPRYPKMHPCGVVLSRQPMHELTPTFISQKGYPTTHLDMDAVEAVGLVKMDILAQGGLAVIRDVKQTLRGHGIEVDLEKFTARQNPKSDVRSPKGAQNPNSANTATSASSEFATSNFELRISSAPANISQAAFDDPGVWEMIASGGARAVHHIESPAMIGLCRMCNVREIDGLIAIVSVIRPGAANEQKKVRFTRRYQGLEPVTFPHPSLEPILRSTFGLVVYEEHILQICEAFAGLSPGRADVLRRALNKENHAVIEEIRKEFFAAARRRGHGEWRVAAVWELVSGFAGYAFCKAHSAAYGVEAYQAAWLKKYFPAEFMAAVLSNGKGFYQPLVYLLECRRLGVPLLPPWVNEPGPAFAVVYTGRTEQQFHRLNELNRFNGLNPAASGHSRFNPCNHSTHPTASSNCAIRVPVTRVKGLTDRTVERLLAGRARGEFASLADFYRRVAPSPEEMEAMLRVGAFDGFGKARTAQFWECQHLYRTFAAAGSRQGWLLPPPHLDRLPEVPLREPTRRERLQWEAELLDFPASGHPLELHDNIAWETYCPVARLGDHVGEEVVTCGLVIEQRVHHQITGEPMKFLTLADWTGIVETELFAPTYRSYGLATVRYPVLEIAATVEPFENGRGHSLRVHRAGKPRLRARETTRME